MHGSISMETLRWKSHRLHRRALTTAIPVRVLITSPYGCCGGPDRENLDYSAHGIHPSPLMAAALVAALRDAVSRMNPSSGRKVIRDQVATQRI